MKGGLHFVLTCKSSSFYHRGVSLSVGIRHWQILDDRTKITTGLKK